MLSSIVLQQQLFFHQVSKRAIMLKIEPITMQPYYKHYCENFTHFPNVFKLNFVKGAFDILLPPLSLPPSPSPRPFGKLLSTKKAYCYPPKSLLLSIKKAIAIHQKKIIVPFPKHQTICGSFPFSLWKFLIYQNIFWKIPIRQKLPLW